MTVARRLHLGVLGSGRGSNLQAILDASTAGRLSAEVVVVLSDVADAYALERARRHHIPALFEDPKGHPTREAFDKALIGHLEQYRVDLVCLAGFMRLLTPAFVAHYRHRIMNIHPALLPAFPLFADPVEQTLAIQKAMATGRVLLEQNRPREAVD